MSLPINVEDIHFGDRDALHEFLKQDKQGIYILENSFVVPPKVKMDDLTRGARYFILGPKGSGKTTLLWHLKRSDEGNRKRSRVVLFKSQIRKEDRDQLDKMVDLIVVQDQRTFRIDADYKTIWEWYILKNLFRLISADDVVGGDRYYRDCVLLLEADDGRFNTLYDKFNVESGKGQIKLSVDTGMLRTEISAQIEARRSKGGTVPLLDLVRLVQAVLPQIRLKADTKVRIYFDELEFFMSDDGDGERDRRMVRDLLFAVHNINTNCSEAGIDAVIYASVRSEILNSIETTKQELNKIISAFSVNLNWHNETPLNHPVLKIIQNKIEYSEIEMCGRNSDNVWDLYFPQHVGNLDIKRYLLDFGLHRPRGVVLRISAAVELAYGNKRFSEEDFLNSEEKFGEMMLEEFQDEIAATYSEKEMEIILLLIRGHHYSFMREGIEARLNKLARAEKIARKFRDEIGVDYILKLLFRVGIIGNQFDLKDNVVRQIWAFRGETNPLLDKRFVVHQSVRKALTTI